MGIVFDGEEDWREEVGKLEWRVFFFFSFFFNMGIFNGYI